MEESGLYKRAHEAILKQIPMLKGETLTREAFYKLLNTHPYDKKHIARRNAINEVLWNMAVENKKKLITKDGRGYKIVDDTLEKIDFKGANINDKLDLVLPFGIHKYCFMYKKNVMMVIGSKDAGKTAIMLNIIHDNMNQYRCIYFSSEMGKEELKNRLSKKSGLSVGDWNFEAYERSYNFDEVIEPDALNFIDYLELGGEETKYYEGVALVRKAFDKIRNGGLFIAAQKNRGAELPKGGSGMLEKARVALSLDPGEATLVVAKNWVDGITTSPKGKKWTYKLVGGINLLNIMDEPTEL